MRGGGGAAPSVYRALAVSAPPWKASLFLPKHPPTWPAVIPREALSTLPRSPHSHLGSSCPTQVSEVEAVGSPLSSGSSHTDLPWLPSRFLDHRYYLRQKPVFIYLCPSVEHDRSCHKDLACGLCRLWGIYCPGRWDFFFLCYTFYLIIADILEILAFIFINLCIRYK